MKIYTKTGDDGSTGILGGQRKRKTDAVIVAIGEVDELNATIGMARIYSASSALDGPLQRTQHALFDLGSELASPDPEKWQLFAYGPDEVLWLEQDIDAQTAVLPPLKEFILPGGSPLAAHLHLSRCVCRRAERSVIEFGASNEIVQYLNRLSDWFFVAARTANAEQNVSDIGWKKQEQR